ncbi:CatB-related O-acetyltransferase [Candidatus Endomicrobiellum devescovinae]|jgi:virginiamycin A acetyltransferase|uniref:CatB-related O-acetyltransferase n=1 Tax=Candidatus Endomicrobiellum devescovinae TaxID=3242322 RepID=UPI00283A1FE3|nr:CatB-related O-acetyltransferase [Endomicrobium sp.]
MNKDIIFPRTNSTTTVLLKNIVKNKNISIGDFTYYDDFVDPTRFEQNNVIYHYPDLNNDKLIIGKFCSIANGVKFLFNAGNHSSSSLANFPFAIFEDLFNLGLDVTTAWNNKGDIVIGNDVWIGYDALIMSGVHIGDGAIIGSRAVVTRDVKPYEVVGGIPAKVIKKRFNEDIIKELLNIRWWDADILKIKKAIPEIVSGNIKNLRELLS